MNIIICDDQKETLKSLSNAVTKIIEKNNFNGSVALETTDPMEVLKYDKISSDNLNIYLLDINYKMKYTGIDLARKLREKNPFCYIVFITGHIEYTFYNFKYNLKSFEYLIKPVEFKDLEKCIHNLYKDYKKSQSILNGDNNNYLHLTTGHKQHTVNLAEIVIVESMAHKLIFKCKDKQVTIYGSLAEYEKKLTSMSKNFLRVHKSYIVNLKNVKKINYLDQVMVMNDGDQCYISRRKKAILKKIMGNM